MTTWVVDDDEWELDDDALVAAPAPPGTIGGVSWSTGPSTFTADDWSGLLGVDVVDVIGDIVVDASTGAALVIGTNVSDDELVRLVNSHVDRLRAIGPDVAQSVRDVLTMAVTSKLTPAEAAALIAAKGPLSEGRALNFARTELAAAANGGMDAAWRAAGVPFKRWRSMHDERVRDAHAAVDGQIVPTGETFRVGGRAARYPGDPNLPIELRVNCFPGDTPVDGAVVSGGMARWYRGDLVRLTFASGDTLAGTANHPVLTERGWTALRDVQVGEHCIGHVLGQDGPGGGQPDVQRQPPTIEQVLETVARRGLVRRVAAVAVDLHGERPKSDVQVVSPDRKLRLGSTPSRLQPAKNLPLTLADVRDRVLATQGAALQLGFGGGLGPAGDVGSAGEGPALGFGHASQPGGQGSAEAATLDPALLQAQLDDLTADPQGDGKGLLGLPGQVALHQVVNVERVPFHGQVFTLETDSGWYLAGTSRIVARNCRCTMERIDADGRVRSDDFGAASRDDLRAIAQQLKVPRYSRMSKTQLRETIEDWSRGFGHQRLDQMSRVQLLQRAKQAGITGRHRMSKAELMRDLRQQIFATRTTTAVDRWRLDNGYVTRQEMGLDVRRAKADAAKAFKAPDQDVAPLDIQQSAALREQVWKRYEGEDRGHVGCASCGAKLTLDGEDGEPMALFRLNPKRGWEARNTIPVCASDATVMASRGVTGFEPRGFVASAGEMANPWHDERGRFARKGAYYVMTMPDGAAVSQREWFGKTLPGQTSVTVGGKQVAVIRNAVNFYGPSAGMQEGQPTGSSQDIDGDIAEIAAVAANVGTLYPEMRVTWITVADAPPARLAKYRGVAGTTDGENVELYARNLHDADGWAYFTGRAKDGPEGNYAMPSALSLTPTTYIAMHEMGHRHSNTMDDFDGRAARLFRSNSSQLSGYGRINWAEAYAEAFTEWHVTNGQTTNLDVQAWAAEFGWRTL